VVEVFLSFCGEKETVSYAGSMKMRSNASFSAIRDKIARPRHK